MFIIYLPHICPINQTEGAGFSFQSIWKVFRMAKSASPDNLTVCSFLRFLFIAFILCFSPDCLCLLCTYMNLPFKFPSVPGGSSEERVKTAKKSLPEKYHWAGKDQYAFLVLSIHLKGRYIICVLSNNPHGSAEMQLNIIKLDKSPCRKIFL